MDNPQDFLEKHCNFDTNQTLFYSFDESIWTSYSVLFTSLVVPCIRDQQELFIAPPSLDIFDGVGFPFNCVLKHIPFATLLTQIISYILSLVAYFSRSVKGSFPCFGLHVLLLPFSFGLLLPLVSVYVKKKKDNVPHTSLFTSVLRFLFPIALASIGLPGLTSLLSSIKDICQCCRGCHKYCTCCTCSACKDCDINLGNLKQYAAKAMYYLHAALIALWSAISLLFIIAPALLFIGNLVITLLNSIIITLVLAVLTYELSVLAKLWKYRSICEAIKTTIRSTLSMQQEFDFSQSIHILAPLSIIYMIAALARLSEGVYFNSGYASIALSNLRYCASMWHSTFSPYINTAFLVKSFHAEGILHFCQSLSLISAIIHCVNEAVFITIVKYILIQKAKKAVDGLKSDNSMRTPLAPELEESGDPQRL